MIEELRKKIDSEIEMLGEAFMFMKRADMASPQERRLLLDGLGALRKNIKKKNNLIPGLLDKIVIEEKQTAEGQETKQISTAKEAAPKKMVKIENKQQILKELEIGENLIKKLKKERAVKEEKAEGFKQARGYLKLSNKLFLKSANKLIRKGYFGTLPNEIKRANLDVLFEAYVAMIIFSVFLSFFVSILFVAVLLLMGFMTLFWIPLLLPPIVFFALYFYPSAEASSISKRIGEELPFAVIHMSSISGSGIEPTEIFKIIGLSKDYPFLRKEIRKILNQINIYGYDLVTALNNVSKSTSNKKLAELLGGLSTTINSGGSLSGFFEKRAETLLVEYRLEKEKFIKVAETFMDIYISIVIAAPMILMLLLVMISVSGISIGFGPAQLTLIIIVGVALINIIFLAFLQVKQS